MSVPRVYVDLDDVLSETTRSFPAILERRFGRRVSFDAIHSFDLALSFGLDESEHDELMRLVHEPEILLGFEPVRGCIAVLEDWERAGCRVEVVTGRPPATADVSREWLESRGIPHHELAFVDKYGRFEPAEGVATLDLQELAARRYDLAVEDAPSMARFLADEMRVPVALVDRPWNGALDEGAWTDLIVRCADWKDVAELSPRSPG